jgi:hypothetical protein
MIKNPHVNKHYSEMGQEYAVRFAWAKKDGDDFILQHNYVICRDFLADAILLGEQQRHGPVIYSFGIQPDWDPQPYLVIKGLEHPEGLDLLTEVEMENGIEPTEVIFKSRGRFVLKVPEFWRSAPVLVSLYSFLIKIYTYNPAEPFEEAPGTEATYIMSTERLLPVMLSNLKKLEYQDFKTFHSNLSVPQYAQRINMFHDYAGFVSQIRGGYLTEQLERL